MKSPRALLSAGWLLAMGTPGPLHASGEEAPAEAAVLDFRTARAQDAQMPAIGFILTKVGGGNAIVISGLSVPASGGPRQLLVRAAGPALAALNLPGAVDDPALAILDGQGAQIAANDNWSGDAAIVEASAQAGAIPFKPDSRDAAVLVSLSPGNYTIQVSSVGGTVGTTLIEVYDVTPGASVVRQNPRPAAIIGLPVPPANRTAVTKDLILHLPLANGLDDVSQSHLPAISRGVTFRDGAAWFDGRESLIAFNHVALNRRPFSISMWVKVESDFPTLGLIEQRAANKRNQHLHFMIRDKAPYLGFYVNDLRTKTPVTPASGWTHLIFQYTGTRQEVWINGKFIASRRAGMFTGASGQFTVGHTPRWTNVPARDFQGGMRDLRVYSRALTMEEIGQLVGPRNEGLGK